jgi:type IV pilus assembly protein PilB
MEKIDVYDSAYIKKVLIDQNYISEEDIRKAEKEAVEQKVDFSGYLVAEKYINEDLLGQAFAEHFKVPYADIKEEKLHKENLSLIPPAYTRNYNMVVIDKNEESVTIATDNPPRIDIDALEKLFPGKTISISYASRHVIQRVLMLKDKSLKVRFMEIINNGKEVAPSFIKEMFEDALVYRASDIHLEPRAEHSLIRFRIDGVLHEMAIVQNAHYEQMVRIIKLKAQLMLDLKNVPQDGAIRFDYNGKNIDLRVSVVPLIDGEKVVIRFLFDDISKLSFTDLGLSKEDQKRVKKVSTNPYGMILAVGPTGAGKSTTLYSILRLLNRPGVNIMTIEDPVEYKVAGVNHMQVNRNVDLTFSRGLRSIVRQDPDVILVGEIRDQETAEIAANAALTGHVVLSSFHANDAATAFPRLLDMGIEPFLLSSTLEMVIGQRLVRRICTACRVSKEYEPAEIESLIPNHTFFFPEQEKITLYTSKGCSKCNNTGFDGRVAIFELIYSTPQIQSLVLQSPTSQQVWELARKQGSRTLFDDGIEKVKSGLTTIEELLRVAMPSNIIQETQ